MRAYLAAVCVSSAAAVAFDWYVSAAQDASGGDSAAAQRLVPRAHLALVVVSISALLGTFPTLDGSRPAPLSRASSLDGGRGRAQGISFASSLLHAPIDGTHAGEAGEAPDAPAAAADQHESRAEASEPPAGASSSEEPAGGGEALHMPPVHPLPPPKIGVRMSTSTYGHGSGATAAPTAVLYAACAVALACAPPAMLCAGLGGRSAGTGRALVALLLASLAHTAHVATAGAPPSAPGAPPPWQRAMHLLLATGAASLVVGEFALASHALSGAQPQRVQTSSLVWMTPWLGAALPVPMAVCLHAARGAAQVAAALLSMPAHLPAVLLRAAASCVALPWAWAVLGTPGDAHNSVLAAWGGDLKHSFPLLRKASHSVAAAAYAVRASLLGAVDASMTPRGLLDAQATAAFACHVCVFTAAGSFLTAPRPRGGVGGVTLAVLESLCAAVLAAGMAELHRRSGRADTSIFHRRASLDIGPDKPRASTIHVRVRSMDAESAAAALAASAAAHEEQPDTGATDEELAEEEFARAEALLASQAERLLAFLKSRLASAHGEAAILRCGADTCAALFPGACALALGCFAEGTGTQAVAMLEVASRTLDGERALRCALPINVGAPTITSDMHTDGSPAASAPGTGGHVANNTSVARVCGPTDGERPLFLDSAAFDHQLAECDDWMLALEGGVESCRAVTAPLQAGAVVVGFLTLHFDNCISTAEESPFDLHRRPEMFASVLRSVSDLIAGAIFVRRAFAIAPDQDAPDAATNANDLLLAAAEREDYDQLMVPAHRPVSPSWRQRSMSPLDRQSSFGESHPVPLSAWAGASEGSGSAFRPDDDGSPGEQAQAHESNAYVVGGEEEVTPRDAILLTSQPSDADSAAAAAVSPSSADPTDESGPAHATPVTLGRNDSRRMRAVNSEARMSQVSGRGSIYAGSAFLAAERDGDDVPSEADDADLTVLDSTACEDAALLQDWELDPWGLEQEAIPRLLVAMLHGCGLLRRFRIRPVCAQAFVRELAAHMPPNPFHNLRHVFAVTATAYRFVMHSSTCRSALEDIDVLALLLSAMCHDLEHPGTTNAFQVNTCSDLALRYNDISVLENHHAATAFSLMTKTQLLQNLSASDVRAVRKRMVSAILATDMGKHKELLSTVGDRIAAAQCLASEEAAASSGGTVSGVPTYGRSTPSTSYQLSQGDSQHTTPRPTMLGTTPPSAAARLTDTPFDAEDSGGPIATLPPQHPIDRAQSLPRPPMLERRNSVTPLERRSSMNPLERRGSHVASMMAGDRFSVSQYSGTLSGGNTGRMHSMTGAHVAGQDRRGSGDGAPLPAHPATPVLPVERRGSLERLRSTVGISEGSSSPPSPRPRATSPVAHSSFSSHPPPLASAPSGTRHSLTRDNTVLNAAPRVSSTSGARTSGSGPRRSSRSSITAAIAELGLALGNPHEGQQQGMLLSMATARASTESARGATAAAVAEYSAFLVAHVFTDSAEDRQLLVSFLLHCSDLCTPLLPPHVSQRVCDDLATEFLAQAERERQANLPVTVMLAADALAKAKMETGFIDYVVRPLYVSLATILPDLGHCLTLIDKNRQHWDQVIKHSSPAAQRVSAAAA